MITGQGCGRYIGTMASPVPCGTGAGVDINRFILCDDCIKAKASGPAPAPAGGEPIAVDRWNEHVKMAEAFLQARGMSRMSTLELARLIHDAVYAAEQRGRQSRDGSSIAGSGK